MLEVRKSFLLQYMLDQGQQLTLHHQRSGFRVLKLVSNLALLVGRIHRADDDPYRGGGDEGDGILGATGHEQANMITLFQSQVMQAVGDTVKHGEHLTIAEYEIVLDDGRAIRG